ncbi:hypothetical protein D3C86_1431350 [compost metagenome]
MGMPCTPQVFKMLKHIFLHSFINTAQVLRTEAKGIFTGKMVEIPTDKHPVKTVIITDENRLSFYIFFEPPSEGMHHLRRIVKLFRLCSCEPGYCQCFGDVLC